MNNLLNKFRHYGTSLSHPRWLNRNIIVGNSISLAISAILVLLTITHEISHPGDNVYLVSLVIITIILSVPFIHRGGNHYLGRTVLTVGVLAGSLALTISRKITSFDPVPIYTFFHSRAAIAMFCIIPFAIIHFKERKLLIINILICLITLLLFDPIHNALGVGYYQLGFSDPDYYYGNFIYLIIFLVLSSAVGFLKFEMDAYEKSNDELVNTLHARNITIEEQKEELTSQSEILKELLKERDKDLSQVTGELINFNHELLQYSYTVSHNLRGPVARLLGLLDMYVNYSDEKEKRNLIGLMLDSTRELDKITLDLNKIVEARSDSFNVREIVNFSTELTQIRKLLATPLRNHGIKLTEEFSVPEIFSARQRINHLIYILITNAIQYRHPDRPAKIKVSTTKKDKWVVLEVQDNGKGIDLNVYKEDVFKPYKYFHADASDKGISLYLAKLEAERLHGKIDVRSTPGEGSIFSVYLKDFQPAA